MTEISTREQEPVSPVETDGKEQRAAMRFGARTDTGRVRNNNEDSHVVRENGAAVCDGLGGHAAGEIASGMAAGIIGDRIGRGIETPEQLGRALSDANAAVWRAAQDDDGLHGMGTTATAVIALPGPGPRVAVANVGDSGTFLYRDGDFIRVTKPHNVAQELIDAGQLTADEALSRFDGHMLTRAVGIRQSVEVDVYVTNVRVGDRFLLASDGLTDMVPSDDIAEALWRHRDPQQCADRLVALANERGGIDNITVVIADIVGVTA